MVRLIRKVAFSSGHRYWRSDLSIEDNRRLFGKWASPFNHGHNYVLEVTTRGEVKASDGMVVNIKDIDAVLQDRIVAVYDQKSLNDEIPAFAHASPSLENLLIDILGRLDDLPDGIELTRLVLHETETLSAAWTPETMTLTRTYEFAASHRLHLPALTDAENVELFGKCNNPMGHGHNYLLEVTVEGQPDARSGMLVDLEVLDRIVEEQIVDRYDHRNLNTDVPELSGKNPTSELVALAIFDRLAASLPVKLHSVTLRETARNAFEVLASER